MLKGNTEYKTRLIKSRVFLNTLIKSNGFNKIKYTLIRSILEEIG